MSKLSAIFPQLHLQSRLRGKCIVLRTTKGEYSRGRINSAVVHGHLV